MVTVDESVTTWADTWQCFTDTSQKKITAKIAGIGIPFKLNLTEWFAPDVAMVKKESSFGTTHITSIL